VSNCKQDGALLENETSRWLIIKFIGLQCRLGVRRLQLNLLAG
jgi:hypothetical protein